MHTYLEGSTRIPKLNIPRLLLETRQLERGCTLHQGVKYTKCHKLPTAVSLAIHLNMEQIH